MALPMVLGGSFGYPQTEPVLDDRGRSSLAEVIDAIAAFDDVEPDDHALAYASALGFHYRFIAACRQLEIEGESPDRIRACTAPVRTLLARSPFLRHLQEWPRGYAGDFEVVEQLVSATNRSEPGTWAWYLEESALHSAAAQQHGRKVQWQAERLRQHLRRSTISEACDAGDQPMRLLVLACGGARDLESALGPDRYPRAEVTLNDIDCDALALAVSRVEGRVGTLDVRHGNAIEACRELRTGPRFQAVLAGGLFDYLDDRTATLLLRLVRGLLEPGGALFFTNIARGNPTRPWMEYAADWRLIERDEDDVARLAHVAGFAREQLRIDYDQTRLAMLVELAR